MTSTPFSLSAYALSRGYRNALEAALGVKPDYLTLPQLRRMPLPMLVKRLRDFRERPALLPFEDEASLAILPILHSLALVANPASIEVISPALERRRLTLADLRPAATQLVTATVRGLYAGLRARHELSSLASRPRAPFEPGTARRVLFVNPNLWFGLKAGGSVGHVAGVVNGFVANNYDVDLFTATEPVLIGGSVHVTQLKPPRAFGVPHELNFQAFQQDALHQVTHAARPPYDFVYQRLSIANYGGVVLARRLRVPLVLEYNGSEVWAARHWGRPLRLEGIATAAEAVSLQHAHVIVTVSEVLREELLGRGIAPERIACYPNCVDVDVYDSARFDADSVRTLRRRYGIAEDAVVATFIGTFGQWHGADLLARAIARLVEDEEQWMQRHKLHFMLVGDGLKMPDVRAEIGGEAYRPYVTLAGLVPQQDGPTHLAASDILLSPHVPNPDGTRFFGSPTKLFEYMATGRPIVASALDQIGEVLTPGLPAGSLPQGGPDRDSQELAVLCEPGSIADLLAGIRFAVERPDWRETLGRNARIRAETRFTWRRHVQEVLDRVDALRRSGPIER